jgi:hypothetical protein
VRRHPKWYYGNNEEFLAMLGVPVGCMNITEGSRATIVSMEKD